MDSSKNLTYIEVNGDSYQIEKFTAKVGLRVGRLVISKLSSIIPMISGGRGEEAEDAIFSGLGVALAQITDDELDKLTTDCLKACYKKLPSGYVKIIDSAGHYAIEDIECDLPTTLRLIFEAIKWGASDFFGEKASALRGLLSSLSFLRNQ